MWMVTKDGFYSVVQDRGDPDRLVVRGRWKKHLKVLKDLLPGSRILVTPEADYPYRMFVSREDWEKVLKVVAVDGIDYPNFKNEAHSRHGFEGWASILNEIWSLVWRAGRDARPRGRAKGTLLPWGRGLLDPWPEYRDH